MPIEREAPPVVDALRSIVRERHAGHVRRAARAWGLAHSTVATWVRARHPRAPQRAHIEAVAVAERVDLAALVHGQVVPVAEQGTASAPAESFAAIATLAQHPVSRCLAGLVVNARTPAERRSLFAARELFLSGTRPRAWTPGASDVTATAGGAFAMREGRVVGIAGIVVELDARGHAQCRRVVLSGRDAQRIERELDALVSSRIAGEEDNAEL